MGECKISRSEQVLVHLMDGIAGIALAVNEGNLRQRMQEQQADQFTAGIPCSTDDAYPDTLVHKRIFIGFYFPVGRHSR
jgi:hypothetical protein